MRVSARVTVAAPLAAVQLVNVPFSRNANRSAMYAASARLKPKIAVLVRGYTGPPPFLYATVTPRLVFMSMSIEVNPVAAPGQAPFTGSARLVPIMNAEVGNVRLAPGDALLTVMVAVVVGR
jgi:hypothetical protein